MNRLRIGAVSYLNTKPLVYGLESCADDIELVFDLPSRLADRLAAGDLDVALIPSVEAVLDPAYTIVSDACIGCRGPVWSVKLLSRVAPEKIKTLALDEGSRTSRVLSRIILQKQFGVSPKLLPLMMTDDWLQADSDAVLIIGDRAMAPDPPEFSFCVGLGRSVASVDRIAFHFRRLGRSNTRGLRSFRRCVVTSSRSRARSCCDNFKNKC